MTAGTSIRKLGAADGGVYRALMLRGYSEHESAFTSTFEERAGKPVDWWTRRLQDPTSATVGAFDLADSLIGTVRLEAYQRLRERHKIQLNAMYVMKDFGGLGVGRRLLDHALIEARKFAGTELINLTVSADNLSAVRLFSHFGFQNFGREPRAVKTALGYIDKLHMWRPVTADYITPT
jgi:GNAT superfamily N-acetyltransferase